MMNYLTRFGRLSSLIAVLSLSVFGLTGCGDGTGEGGHEGTSHAGEDTDAEYERGPFRGRMLRDGDFSLEVTIFEAGQEPQFRVYPRLGDDPVDPQQVRLTINLSRLDGQVDRIGFQAQDDYLAGREVVVEPHSFDVEVEAEHGGVRHVWAYPSYEGRTIISTESATAAGVVTEPAGAAVLIETLELLGRVDFAPGARVEVRARFPGQVKSVAKSIGNPVRAGDTLARVESNDSLRAYAVTAPIDGVVIKRLINPGEVTGDGPVFVIGDLNRLRVDFHVFPGDVGRVRAGQRVTVRGLEGKNEAQTTIASLLPTAESLTQALIARVGLSNPDNRWVPGLLVKGEVAVSEDQVPLAVRTSALQRFRDFTVVFAQVGETYEVRMLELGRRSSEWTEVLGGIKSGQPYVVGNSYLIKADIEKSGASHDH